METDEKPNPAGEQIRRSFGIGPAQPPIISGPAGVKYGSLEEAATQYIQDWLPEWPEKHYMLPPAFHYKFTEPYGRADGAVKGQEPDCEDRSMDRVYREVNRFMAENRVPGVVFNSFSMKTQKALLEHFLAFCGKAGWKEIYRDIECDLLIWSPQMGFVAFEVKGSSSRTSGRAAKRKAQKQASTTHIRGFLEFLKTYSGIKKGGNTVPIRRIVAWPLRSRDKFAQSDLQDEDVDKFMFSQDFSLASQDEDRILGNHSGFCLKEFVVLKQPGAHRSDYIPLMRTLITIWALRTSGSEAVLDPVRSSMPHAIAENSQRVKEQEWWKEKPETKSMLRHRQKRKVAASCEQAAAEHGDPAVDGPKTKIIRSAPDSVMMTDPVNRVLFLTPKQQEILDGPRVQLILGPAGTGKSVLILIKAAQLIRSGESVAIISADGMALYYKMWKKHNGFSHSQCLVMDYHAFDLHLDEYMVGDTPVNDTVHHGVIQSALVRMSKALLSSTTQADCEEITHPDELVLGQLNRLVDEISSANAKLPSFVSGFSKRSIFLDDVGTADVGSTAGSGATLLYYAFSNAEEHYLWIAGDLFQRAAYGNLGDHPSLVLTTLSNLIGLLFLLTGRVCSKEAGTLSVLRSVLRCSRRVFEKWYTRCKSDLTEEGGSPSLSNLYGKVYPGHQLMGPEVTEKECATVKQSVAFISKEVSDLVTYGVRPRDIAIIGIADHVAFRKEWKKAETTIPLTSISKQQKGKDAIALDYCATHIASLEWPIVFAVNIPNYGILANGMSRARSKLVVVTMPELEGSDESDERSHDDAVMSGDVTNDVRDGADSADHSGDSGSDSGTSLVLLSSSSDEADSSCG